MKALAAAASILVAVEAGLAVSGLVIGLLSAMMTADSAFLS